jgi:hypothetical protein
MRQRSSLKQATLSSLGWAILVGCLELALRNSISEAATFGAVMFGASMAAHLHGYRRDDSL